MPRLHLLNVLLGSQAALDPPTRMDQRLLADDLEERPSLRATRWWTATSSASTTTSACPSLRVASSDHANVASAEHCHRVSSAPSPSSKSCAIASGTPAASRRAGRRLQRRQVGNRCARVAHAGPLALRARMRGRVVRHGRGDLGVHCRRALDGVQYGCLSCFSPDPEVQARPFSRRLKRRWPGSGSCWDYGTHRPNYSETRRVVRWVLKRLWRRWAKPPFASPSGPGRGSASDSGKPPFPEAEAERLDALHASGALDPHPAELHCGMAARCGRVRRAADHGVDCRSGHTGSLRRIGRTTRSPRSLSVCGHCASNQRTSRFCAGAPLRWRDGLVLEAWCLLATASEQHRGPSAPCDGKGVDAGLARCCFAMGLTRQCRRHHCEQ